MLLAQCEEPGASVAHVAMAHGINENGVRRWRQLALQREGAPLVASVAADCPALAEFVPLALPAPDAVAAKTEVRLEVRSAAVSGSVAWSVRFRLVMASKVRGWRRSHEPVEATKVALLFSPLDERPLPGMKPPLRLPWLMSLIERWPRSFEHEPGVR
jgi:transposase